MYKIGICGHYGGGHQYLDGQTVKTKIVTTELKKQFGEDEVVTIDTHGGINALIKGFNEYIFAFKNCENIVMLPAENGLKVLAPMFAILNKHYHCRLHYIVIGGWLPDFILAKKLLTYNLMKFDCIYVETNQMKNKLESMGFSNVKVMTNCKELRILRPDELVYRSDEPYKLCTFSRVMKEKGIEDAINAVRSINEDAGRSVFGLDIYGQIDGNQTQWFEKLRKSFPDYIKYGGMVPFDKSTEVLKEYHALLFPTYYEGEGFAGTLIDAMAAGVPAIASDWKYNPEIVRHGETGFLYKTHDIGELARCIIQSIKDNEKWGEMKQKSIEKAIDFLPENALRSLFESI